VVWNIIWSIFPFQIWDVILPIDHYFSRVYGKLTGAYIVGKGWEWGNGVIITSDYGSFPHSLLSTSKIQIYGKT
jgi:hypothetical protein